MHALAVRLSFVAVLVFLVATSASAVVSSGTASILIDADRNTNTGCTINVPSGASVFGIETLVKMLFDTVGNNMVVTGVTKQQCVAGVLGAPIDILMRDSHTFVHGQNDARDR